MSPSVPRRERVGCPSSLGLIALSGLCALAPGSVYAQGVELVPPPEPDTVTYVERAFANLADRPGSPRMACDRAICVHYLDRSDEEASGQLLLAARSELDALLALKLPRPPSDGALGGDGRLDIYLDGRAPRAEAFVDPGSASSGVDRASSFVVAPPLGSGCVRRRELGEALGQVLLLGQDGALDPGARAMLGGYLGSLSAPCGLVDSESVDTAQRAPERNFVGPLGESAPASFLFPQFLEDSFGAGAPGTLTVALAAISSQRTTKGPLLDEPDLFDVLRVTQTRNKSSLGDTLLGFAEARVFLGDRSDDAHMLDVASLGRMGRPRFEWSVPYATLPRRLAPLRPIEPLGFTYLHIDLTGTKADSELTFAADWEEPVVFRWALLKLDESGAPIARIEVVPVLGETHAQQSIRDLGGAKSLVIIGVNEGEARRDEPFDPGRVRQEPHGYLVTVYP